MATHVICLTKNYNENDFDCFVKYYNSLNVQLHIIDNGCDFDVTKYKTASVHKLDGWANQWHLFNDILNNNLYEYDFKNDDYIIFADDDEYFWFDERQYKSITEAITAEFSKTALDVLMLPQILMSTKHLLPKREENYVMTHYYRRQDYSSQGKCIIRYNENAKYSFSKANPEVGHIPYIKYADDSYFRFSKVVGSDESKTTYGITDYNAPLRLYHYHIKSEQDWTIKMQRGSAACKQHPYKEDITKNINYGDYNVFDITMRNYFIKYGFDKQ